MSEVSSEAIRIGEWLSTEDTFLDLFLKLSVSGALTRELLLFQVFDAMTNDRREFQKSNV